MSALIGSIQIAKKTKAAWDTQAPVLLSGQLVAETDGVKTRVKVGDGVAGYATLKYITVKDSDEVSEGVANLYYTNARVEAHGDTIYYRKTVIDGMFADAVKTPLPLDCSLNPNYPAATKGTSYKVSVAGKIGGVAGVVVEIGDLLIASVASAAGDHATVGANWGLYQTNLDKSTDVVFGTARRATTTEGNSGTDDVAYMTSLKVKGFADSRYFLQSGGALTGPLTGTSAGFSGNIYTQTPTAALWAGYSGNMGNYDASLSWNALQLGNNGPNWIVAGHNVAGGSLTFYVNNTSRVTNSVSPNGIVAYTINAAGNNIWTGAGNFGGNINVQGASSGLTGINLPNTNYIGWYTAGTSGAQGVAIRGTADVLEMSSGGGESGRFTAQRFFKASNNGIYTNSVGLYHELDSNTLDNNILFLRNSSISPYGININFNGASTNNTANTFIYTSDSVAPRFIVYSNGGIANYSANNTNLSDRRVKKNIKPVGSMWETFKAIEIVDFDYKDQTHNDTNLGVIAQQVKEVAPRFVDTDGFGKTPKDGIPLMAVYDTDIQYGAIKALQEAMIRIEKLEQKLNQYEN